jgi:hypothetical protein
MYLPAFPFFFFYCLCYLLLLFFENFQPRDFVVDIKRFIASMSILTALSRNHDLHDFHASTEEQQAAYHAIGVFLGTYGITKITDLAANKIRNLSSLSIKNYPRLIKGTYALIGGACVITGYGLYLCSQGAHSLYATMQEGDIPFCRYHLATVLSSSLITYMGINIARQGISSSRYVWSTLRQIMPR